MATYTRPVKNYSKHPISAPWRKPGPWAAGHHTGVDIACPVGTPVYATIGGDVTGPHLHLERRPRYGKYGSDKNPNLWP